MADPRLDADFTPSPASPALGLSASTLDANLDAYDQPRGIDRPGVVSAQGRTFGHVNA